MNLSQSQVLPEHLRLPLITMGQGEWNGSIRQPAPLLGQHTCEILHDVFGYSPEQIAGFEELGVF